MTTKKSALGRGLSAILESPETDITSRDISGEYVVGAIANIELGKIEANPFQPRNNFEAKALDELARSIREQGVIQPVTVRKMGFDKYQLISGERRFKAAHIAGLKEIPSYIRIANDQQMLEMALIENIHRRDLNPIEIALSYQRLMEECKITLEEMSGRLGKDRSTVTNFVRLLKLPPEIQLAIREEEISMGHARALITIPELSKQLAILNKITDEKLSVRDVEKLVKEEVPILKKKQEKSTPALSEKHQSRKQQLSRYFDTPVEIKTNTKGKGSIVIPFKTEDEFDRIISILEQNEE